jgi:hypothetical protein
MDDNARVLHLQQAQQTRLDLFHLNIAQCQLTKEIWDRFPGEKVSIDQRRTEKVKDWGLDKALLKMQDMVFQLTKLHLPMVSSIVLYRF